LNRHLKKNIYLIEKKQSRLVGFQVVYGLREIKIQRNKNCRFSRIYSLEVFLFFQTIKCMGLYVLEHKQEEVIHLGIQYISTEKGENLEI